MHKQVLQNPIFRVLSEEVLLNLLKQSDLQVLAPDDVLIHEGEFNHFLYMLTEGMVRVVANGETIAELGVGDVVGEISTMGMSTPVADVVAIGTVKAIAFPIELISDLGLRYPDFADQLRALSAERIY